MNLPTSERKEIEISVKPAVVIQSADRRTSYIYKAAMISVDGFDNPRVDEQMRRSEIWQCFQFKFHLCQSGS